MMGCELEWAHLKPAPEMEQRRRRLEELAPEEREELEEEEDGEDEDKFSNYLRLDTIEEEEGDEAESDNMVGRAPPQKPLKPPQAEPRASKLAAPATATSQVSQASHPSSRLACDTSDDDLEDPRRAAAADQEEERVPRNGSRPAPVNQHTQNHHNDKCDSQQPTGMGSASKNSAHLRNQQLPLPSTNRLISEHQARQQQALFRALAERQKMLDELGGGAAAHQRDLMAAGVGSGELRRLQGQRRRRRRRHRSHSERRGSSAEAAVPLSSVDLSQMSDGMLEDLLGHIASASSSSLSSNGESIDSSSPSSSGSCSSAATTGSDDSDSEAATGQRRQRQRARRRRLASAEDTPNVVGVHEDERAGGQVSVAGSATGGASRLRQSNCREAHRRARSLNRRDSPDDDDSDPRSEHELALEPDSGVSGAGDSSVAVGAGHLSPAATSPNADHHLNSAPSPEGVAGQLEQYFTSNLVQPHQFPSGSEEGAESPVGVESPNGGVEEVLSKMLAQLSELGPNDEERLNELLERGFAHLEHLLNWNLSPTGSGPQQQQQQQQPRAGSSASQLAQKLLANQQQAGGSQTLLSKDSDYGSDTQSAECLSHEPGGPPTVLKRAPTTSQLSPLAIELSFKLAESLQRLAGSRKPGAAQQQLQQQQVDQPLPAAPPARRAPMKSVVLVNATPATAGSRPESSLSGDSAPRNWTPVEPAQQVAPASKAPVARPNFTTRVNLGSSAEVSSVLVAVSATPPVSAAAAGVDKARDGAGSADYLARHSSRSQEPDPHEQVAAQPQHLKHLEAHSSAGKRRSPRSSMRGRKPGARPGSPLPRLLLEEANAGSGAPATHELQPPRLQRALELAQKYQYSPAKLAASKLGHQLQLHTRPPATESPRPAGPISVPWSLDSSRLAAAAAAAAHHKEPMDERTGGRIQLDVSYLARSGSLSVHVIQCANLPAANKRRNTSNPYIKLYLLPERSKSGKRKSAARRHELEPRFDERFTFGPLALADFEARTLWLSVCHKDRLGRNELLGELLLPLAQVRHQLLASDLCQSTGARWYELTQQTSTPTQATTTTGAPLAGAGAPQAPLRPGASETTQESQPSIGAYLKQSPSGPSSQAALITGQLFVALKFHPLEQASADQQSVAADATGELQVIIKEAHNISGYVPVTESPQLGEPPVTLPTGPLPNPFCKCYLLNQAGQRLSKQRTPHLKRTVNPRWDHKCVFGSLRLASLAGQALEIQMYNRDSVLVSSEYLGGIRLCGAGSQQTHLSTGGASLQGPQSDSVSLASSAGASQQPLGGGGDGSSLQRPSLLAGGAASFSRDSTSSNRSLDGADSLAAGAGLCNEREARLWARMLARPDTWVYGELNLRYLHPLVPT